MNTYRQCSLEEKRKLASDVMGNVVFDGEKYWLVKNVGISTGEEKVEYLAFKLGREIANIAEVRLINRRETDQIRGLFTEDYSGKVSYLVRLAGSYTLNDLPIKDLEKAVAVELVFSLWIMRRDTHSRNRAYVEGKIPIFFDHGTSFLREPTLVDIQAFFQRIGEGLGGNWRVVEKKNEIITTAQAREKNVDFHYVNNLHKFQKVLDGLKNVFRSMITIDWRQIVQSSVLTHYSPKAAIVEALENNLSTIDKRIDRMKQVIFRNTNH